LGDARYFRRNDGGEQVTNATNGLGRLNAGINVLLDVGLVQPIDEPGLGINSTIDVLEKVRLRNIFTNLGLAEKKVRSKET
jgi:hypothetical protein